MMGLGPLGPRGNMGPHDPWLKPTPSPEVPQVENKSRKFLWSGVDKLKSNVEWTFKIFIFQVTHYLSLSVVTNALYKT